MYVHGLTIQTLSLEIPQPLKQSPPWIVLDYIEVILGIMEKKMETAIVYWGCIGVKPPQVFTPTEIETIFRILLLAGWGGHGWGEWIC